MTASGASSGFLGGPSMGMTPPLESRAREITPMGMAQMSSPSTVDGTGDHLSLKVDDTKVAPLSTAAGAVGSVAVGSVAAGSVAGGSVAGGGGVAAGSVAGGSVMSVGDSKVSVRGDPSPGRLAPLHVHGGTGIRAILQFLVISAHHSRLIFFVRGETGRMAVYAFFVLSGFVTAMAATEPNLGHGKADKGRPPKLWLRSSLGSWAMACGRFYWNLLMRRTFPLLALSVFLTGYYLLVKSLDPAPIPTWDFITATWAFHHYEKPHWWQVTPNGWYVSALMWYLLILPVFVILARGVFKRRWMRSLLIIPAAVWCGIQNWYGIFYRTYFTPYPFMGWMFVCYCVGSMITDFYPTVQRLTKSRSIFIRIPVELGSLASVYYFNTQPVSRLKCGANDLGFLLLCLFRPTVSRCLDCRWFNSVASGTIPLLAYLCHGILGLQVFSYLQIAANPHVWFLYLATWFFSITLEAHVMDAVVKFTKKVFVL